MKNQETMKNSVFSIDDLLNPANDRDSHSFRSCEDRCNKLEVRRSRTRHAGG